MNVEIRSRDFWFKVVGMLPFASEGEAATALRRNGFSRLAENGEEFLRPPSPPFVEGHHSNGAIYSSARFWRSKP
jgi:hypothetical protein